MKKSYVVLLALWICGGVYAFAQRPQVSISRLDVSSSFSRASLGSAELLSQSESSIEVFLIARIAGLQEKSRVINLPPGVSQHDLSGLGITNPNRLGTQTEQGSNSLEICLEVYWVENQEKLASQCEELIIEPLMPPYLVFPFDGEALENPLPIFTWTPPSPISVGKILTYRIRVVELHGLQSPIVAVNQAPAIIEQYDLLQTTLPYPIGGASLHVGSKYAWQIEAYCDGRSLGRSEVWTFHLKEEEKKEIPDPKPFVELKTSLDAGFYPAYGQIKIRFDRQFGEQELAFQIFNEAHQLQEVKGIEIEEVGNNRFILKLASNCGLIDKTNYLLAVTDAQGQQYWLRFKFFQV